MKNQYTEYSNFKHRVLKKAVEEINSKTDIIFDYEEITEVKKVVALKFTIKPVPVRKKREVLDPEFSEPIIKIFEKNNITLDKVVLKRRFKLGQIIYVENEEINKNVHKIVEQVFELNSFDNPIGFITYILNLKVEYISAGKDHNEVKIKYGKEEKVPDWFQKSKDERNGIHVDHEELSE